MEKEKVTGAYYSRTEYELIDFDKALLKAQKKTLYNSRKSPCSVKDLNKFIV